jgi:hypothetical protein
MKLRTIGALTAAAVVAFAGCTQGGSGGGTYKLAIDMPQQGSELAGSEL